MDKIRVLLVDDHPVLRLGLRALIDGEPGLRVVGEADDGAAALAATATLTPDVVIMDISMPGMDGLEATRRIRDAYPATKVLILTVHAQERYLFPVLKAGAAGYVLKSTVDTALIDAIRTVAQGGAFLYPSATRMLLEDYLGRLESGGEADAYEGLSEREREVLKLIALGHTAAQVAEKCSLSPKTLWLPSVCRRWRRPTLPTGRTHGDAPHPCYFGSRIVDPDALPTGCGYAAASPGDPAGER